MTVPERLTSGMVGKQLKFEFSPEWDSLRKTAVYMAGDACWINLNVGDTDTIPAEVLVKPMYPLFVGVYGVSADGELVVPTIRARGPLIEPGADASGDPAADPELPAWAQLQVMIGDLSQLATEDKTNLVAAINALAAGMGSDVSAEEVQQIVEEYLAANPPADGASPVVSAERFADESTGESGVEVTIIPVVSDGEDAPVMETQRIYDGKNGARGYSVFYTQTEAGDAGEVYFEKDLVDLPAGITEAKPGDMLLTADGKVYSVTELYVTTTSGSGVFTTSYIAQFAADLKGQDGAAGAQGTQGEKGDTGPQGPAGADGKSPTITLEETDSGVLIDVTNPDGSVATALVRHGEDGGKNGLSLYFTAEEPTIDEGYPFDPGQIASGGRTLQVGDMLLTPSGKVFTVNGVSEGMIDAVYTAVLQSSGAVQPDWSAGEGESGYVKNRTHWTEEGIVELLPETALPQGGEGVWGISSDMRLEAGKTYMICYNGTEYTCDALEVNADADGFVMVGNPALFGFGESTGEPFGLAAVGGSILVVASDEPTEVTVSIKVWDETAHPLDEKFLPGSVGSIILRSSTAGSTKRFKVTIDDSGTLTAAEVI